MPMPKTRAPEPQDSEAREALLDDLDARSRALLSAWMNEYDEIASERDELNKDLEKLKTEKIEPLRLKLGLTKIDSDEWYIARRPGRPNLDKEKAKRHLFEKGVRLDLITEAFRVATSIGKPFTEIKRKKDKE